MVHHYMEDDPKYERTEPTVKSVMIPHPDATLEEVAINTPPPPPPAATPPTPAKTFKELIEPPPIARQEAMRELFELPPIPECCPMPSPILPDLGFHPADPMVRDLAISLFAAFCLGVSVTTIIAVYSSRLSKYDA